MRDILKNIKNDVINNISRFVAIAVITAVLLSFTIGLLYAYPNLSTGAEKYYLEKNYWDIKISSQSFFQKVIDAIKNDADTEGLTTQVSFTSKGTLNGQGEYNVRFKAVDFEIVEHNPKAIPFCPTLLRGSYPKNETACIVAVPDEEYNGIKIGDKITLSASSIYTEQKEFTVIGIVKSDLYNQSEILAYVQKNAVHSSITATELLINLKSLSSLSTFSKEYAQNIDASKTRLLGLCNTAQYGQVENQEDNESQLQKAQKEYDFLVNEAKTDLDELTKNIDNVKRSVDNQQKGIEIKEKEVNSIAAQINAQKQEAEALIEKGDAASDEEKEKVAAYNTLVEDYQSKVTSLDLDKANLELNVATYDQLIKDKDAYKQISDEKIAVAKAKVEALKNNDKITETAEFSAISRLDNISVSSFGKAISNIYRILPIFLCILALVCASVVVYAVCGIYSKNKALNIFGETVPMKKNLLICALDILSCLLAGTILGTPIGMFLAPKAVYKFFAGYPYSFNFEGIYIIETLIPIGACLVLFVGISLAAYFVINKFFNKPCKAKIPTLSRTFANMPVPIVLILKNALQYKSRYIMPLICMTALQICILPALSIGCSAGVILLLAIFVTLNACFVLHTLENRVEEVRSRYIMYSQNYTAIGIVIESVIVVIISIILGTIIVKLAIQPFMANMAVINEYKLNGVGLSLLIFLTSSALSTIATIFIKSKKPAE